MIVPQYPDTTQNDANGIYKYNSICREWTKILDYPKDFISTGHLSTIDQKQQIIYVCNEQSQLLKINLINKSIEIMSYKANFGAFPRIIFFNDKIHIIGGIGIKRGKHNIFCRTRNEFDEIYDFNRSTEHGFQSHFTWISKPRASIITTTYDHNNKKSPVSVIEFKNNKWTNIDIKNCKYLLGSSIISTTNGDYFIFLSGCENTPNFKCHQLIFVYYVKHKKLAKSNITTPATDAIGKATLTRNEEFEDLLTFGYVHDCYKIKNFKNMRMIPFYLIQLIGKWICYETIHLFTVQNDKDRTKKHWTIDVDKIIQSVMSEMT